ncbi:MAG: four helix bundle protein [Ignavibacteriae bacterium]|nr:MAG: four helix bundle protein [Ignavibacteriota bacterium]
MKDNIIIDKSYNFAVHALKTVKFLDRSIENYVLVKQLVRAATSIGANAEEAQGGHTKKDFYYKLNISFKEAKETKYWLRLIKDTQAKMPSQEKDFNDLMNEADEICKILYSILKTNTEK